MPISSPRRLTERAAGIARVDRGVGLDEVLVAVGVDAGAAERADDPGGDGVLQAEGIADGDHEVADLGRARNRRARSATSSSALTLSTAMSEGASLPTTVGLEVAAVLQRHRDLGGVLDHVRVGEDVAALGVDDDAGAGALELALARTRVRGTSKKRRKKGSSSSGFCWPRSCTVPRVAMLTTAGETRLTIGASVGSGVSPTMGGSPAGSEGAASASRSPEEECGACHARGILPRGPQPAGAGNRQSRQRLRRCRLNLILPIDLRRPGR